MTEKEFFIDFLGISESDFNRLRYSVRVQHQIASGGALRNPRDGNFNSYMENMAIALGKEWDVSNFAHQNEFLQLWEAQFSRMHGRGDFAHMSIILATHLASDTGNAGQLSGVAGDRAYIERLAGWLGDATLKNPGDDGISFGADDYIADLDAANISYIMRTQNLQLISATNLYYSQIGPERTRAEVFLEHTPLETVVIPEILRELGIDNQQIAELRGVAPDSYDFVESLRRNLHNMESFAE